MTETHCEAEFTHPTERCPNPAYWHTYDAQSTEVEVIEMVAGMIRGLQPEVVLETGTSNGWMANSIGAALNRNGHGILHTFEPHTATWNEAKALVSWREHVVLHNEPSMVPWTFGPIDFAWHDSLVDLRRAEFEFYLPHYSDQVVLGFHDTAPHFGTWPKSLAHSLQSNGFSLIELPTPRGVILACKVGS